MGDEAQLISEVEDSVAELRNSAEEVYYMNRFILLSLAYCNKAKFGGRELRSINRNEKRVGQEGRVRKKIYRNFVSLS
jgi:hypothetical protein